MNKKEKIIYAAIECFKEKGTEDTKVSDIVNLAGVAQGTFYLYFPSKSSVIPAIAEIMVEKVTSAVERKIQDNTHFPDKLSQIVDVIFDFNKEYQEIQALIYRGLASTKYIYKWETIYEPIYMWLTGILSEAKDTGMIRNSIHVERTSRLFLALVESAAEQIYLYDHKNDDQATLQKNEVLDFLTHALDISK